jgi:hypothetical protein
LPFFVTRLRQNLLRRELATESLKDPDVDPNDDIEDFAFKKLRDQAKKEIKNNLAYLLYRSKYNLPPNDPRFLDLTDEDIVYELVLQSEFNRWEENRQDEEDTDDKRVIYKNTEEYDALVKRLERGEDIDLESLMTPKEDWEDLNGNTNTS